MDQELLKLGIAGLVCVVLWIMLIKSEKREEKKDARIQDLEKKLTDSYAERIIAADSLANALHNNAIALSSLEHEIRSNNANHH